MTEERLEDVITHKESKPPGMIKKFQKGYSYIPQKRYNSSRGIVAGIVGFLLLVSMPGFISWLKEPKPPAPDVVASYNDKTITVEELREFVKIEMAREMEHYICEEHGLDHSPVSYTHLIMYFLNRMDIFRWASIWSVMQMFRGT